MKSQGSYEATAPWARPHDSIGDAFATNEPFVNERKNRIVNKVASNSVQYTLGEYEVPDLCRKTGKKDC